MKIAVIGSGGREHALVWKLGQSPAVRAIHALPGNGGIAALAQGRHGQQAMRAQLQAGLDIVVESNIKVDDVEALCRYIEHNNIDLTVVGPEAALLAGLVDRLQAEGRRVFGPTRRAARVESSKIWAKQFMQRHGIATADYWSGQGVRAAAKELRRRGGEAVLKFDGLAAGKGVFVCHDMAEAEQALQQVSQRYGVEAPLVVEERLDGVELSLMGLCDGRSIHLLSPSKDHKALLDGDRGPNTGGMGAYCPAPHASAAVLEQVRTSIIEPTLAGLADDGIAYMGFLYFGLMLTEQGPRLLEYNARLGDPETEVLLPALDDDLVALIESCLDGALRSQAGQIGETAWVDVVLASRGYPGRPEINKRIMGLNGVGEGPLVFHAGTRLEGEQVFSSGGRVLNIVCSGATLNEAAQRCYGTTKEVNFDGKIFRDDIARGLS